MEADCAKHVRHCHLCQVYADQIKAPPNELHPMAAPWPFSMWGIDWIEAITLASVTIKAVARFLKCNIIARYGVPATIITDNAKNLNNKIIDELCEQFKVQHRNSTPYRPQMNCAVEAANKNIKKIIEKMTVLHITPDSRGKFAYMYDGPFVVRETFSGGAIILSDMDETENALLVNADALKKYYP
ncbi:hypothetical protein CRG98_026898 [Punica granatum]|uniref:Integrase catalytic domain-containing protein n=1 Tax=Punica granatum TaxID=22663 RepID=A0A2I0J908_PUNGR|nr:hypothetical protein CRG98_026898 [Punica granatum]